MPFIWLEYGRWNVLSDKVYMKFEDCVKSIKERIEKNPDDFPYHDFCEWSSTPGEEETDCVKNGSIIYIFYDDYDKEFQIQWVDIV